MERDIVLSIITSVFGLLTGYFINYFTNKVMLPTWQFKNTNVVNDRVSVIEGLEVTYQGQKIPTMSIITIAFWNNGKEAICEDAIGEPIRFVVAEGYKFFGVSIDDSSIKKSNEFRVSVDKNQREVFFHFKYLNYKDGAIVRVISDCTEISKFDIKGDIIGAKKLKLIKHNKIADILITVVFESISIITFFLLVVGLAYQNWYAFFPSLFIKIIFELLHRKYDFWNVRKQIKMPKNLRERYDV